jgi:argininosuccinate lyase
LSVPKLWDKGYQLDREIEAFTVGTDYLLDRELVWADCAGSVAQARMLARIGVLSDAEVSALTDELRGIVRDPEFRILPEQEDVHTAVEQRLVARLGDTGKKIHTARSRNDQVIVDLRLWGKARVLGVMGALLALARALTDFAERHQGVPMVGRTHMQRAMPSSVGLWAGAFAESLLDDFDLLEGAYRINDQCPLGSAASYGVPLAIDRQYVSDLLGFARVQNNVLYANNSRGKTESIILAALVQIGVDLSRFAEDALIFSLPEFGYFSLPDELCTGSSIMPNKKNPGGLEKLRSRAASLIAELVHTLELLRGLPSGYNRDVQDTKEPFVRGCQTAGAMLAVGRVIAERMRVNEERCVAAFDGEVFATDRALELVLEGVPFRDAYRQVAATLGELGARDPRAAIAKKTHLGAPANLGLDLARERIAAGERMRTAEEERFEQVLGELLGADFHLAV